MNRAFLALAAALAIVPAAAEAQSYQCAIPRNVPRPRADLPSASTPKRLLPIGGYTLALTWAPQYCHEHADDRSARFQCGVGNRFGFTLHGLWPDGEGKDWPQYCTATSILPQGTIRRNLCATPSAQLLQHEWAKHGTCMGTTPGAYFKRSGALYSRLRYPDMDALSRQPGLTAGAVATAIARGNPGLPANAIRVTATKSGWLDELWLCLDKQFRYARCVPNSGGLAGGDPIKIWRGAR